ncbi:MAG TPA: GNAT family N-acetyltransferase [Candidatus Dormibacteraeota bacterium]
MASLHLSDGSTLQLRPLEPEDGALLARLFYRLSPETVYKRFLSPIPSPYRPELQRLLEIDHRDREALAVLSEGEVVAVVRYARDAQHPEVAEIAIVVEDGWQRRGLGALLIRRLAAVARRRGIGAFHATMLGDNRPAMRLLRGLSAAARFQWSTGELEAEVPLRAPTPTLPAGQRDAGSARTPLARPAAPGPRSSPSPPVARP